MSPAARCRADAETLLAGIVKDPPHICAARLEIVAAELAETDAAWRTYEPEPRTPPKPAPKPEPTPAPVVHTLRPRAIQRVVELKRARARIDAQLQALGVAS